MPKFYDQSFSPNQSDNADGLSGYPTPLAKLNGDEMFDFYNYVTASLLYEYFTQVCNLNNEYLGSEFSNVSFDENLNLQKLKLVNRKFKDYIEIDTSTFKGNFNYLPEWQGETMPDNLYVEFIATPISASLRGKREMIIYRKNFFEFHVKAEILGVGYNKSRGYINVQFTNFIKFEKLTSQHYLSKVYKAYCQELTSLLERRYNNIKNIEDYHSEHMEWFKTP